MAEEHLVKLYRSLYDLTNPECGKCRLPHSCCSGEYCEATIEYAKESWNTILERTDHPKLPLMGPNGCIAAPHLRPSCTMHTCQVNGFGFKPDDPKWTNKYFSIREEIEGLEYKRMTGK